MTQPSVLMVAIGGYGYYYLQTLLEQVGRQRIRLAGVVDPQARESRAWPDVERLSLPVAPTMEAFYENGGEADLAVIVSPIQHHVPQSIVALAHGSHVLCDKPLGATIQEAQELIEARDRSGRFVMIGYQWSYSAAIQSLKRDILAGAFGRPRRFSTLCCWPRDHAYYARNHWAGRLVDPRSGRWVLDSPSNNGMAHFLHNLLYLAGPEMPASAVPVAVQGERYRAYDIEASDTTCLRVLVEGGLELLQWASHVTEQPVEPRFRLEFDEAVVTYGEEGPRIVARGRAGRVKDYGSPEDTPHFQKLFDAIAAAGALKGAPYPETDDGAPKGAPYREGDGEGSAPAVVCGPEAAAAQTLAINGLHESRPDSLAFPASLITDEGPGGRRLVKGLGELLERCYTLGRLPSEAGAEWAVSGPRVRLDGYTFFPASHAIASTDRRS